MGRTLLASIPSGCEKIVSLRQSMQQIMIGEGWTNHSWVIPTISHPDDLLNPEIYGPRVIFVGKAIQWLQCTPWVNPCDISPIRHPQVGQPCFLKYCELRADLDELINLLFG